MIDYYFAWMRAFLLTLAIELPIYWVIGHRFAKGWKTILGGLVGTGLSHPFLWFFWVRMFTTSQYRIYAGSGETIVILFEAVVFWLIARPIPLRYAVVTSLLANVASVSFGILV